MVDDYDAVTKTLSWVFESAGFDVHCASSGTAALSLASTYAFDEALVDLHMPGMNGIEVCRGLKDLAATRGNEISVRIMTGAGTLEEHRQTLAAGATEVLMKPFRNAELLGRMGGVLGAESPDQ